jgi:hypothetical protein
MSRLCKTNWLSVAVEDYVDEVYKFVIVGKVSTRDRLIRLGYHENNKLFVRFGTNWPWGDKAKTLRLALFDVEALKHFAKEGKIPIGSREGPEGKWNMEAHFIVEKGVAKGRFYT